MSGSGSLKIRRTRGGITIRATGEIGEKLLSVLVMHIQAAAIEVYGRERSDWPADVREAVQAAEARQ